MGRDHPLPRVATAPIREGHIENPTCGDCRFWGLLPAGDKIVLYSGPHGSCRGHAPSAPGLVNWPVTPQAEPACGDFRPRRK